MSRSLFFFTELELAIESGLATESDFVKELELANESKLVFVTISRSLLMSRRSDKIASYSVTKTSTNSLASSD